MVNAHLKKKLFVILYKYRWITTIVFFIFKFFINLNEKIIRRFVTYQISNLKNNKQDDTRNNNSIMFVIPNLGPGGSERQITNVIIYLDNLRSKKLLPYDEIILVCFDCSKYPYDFYLDKIPDNVKVFNLIDNYRIKTLAESFKRYPKLFWLGTEIFYLNELVKLISELRPRVINGWLDSPSIICGLAGIIHSVPKIVLSSRNMNPSRFLTFRSFMKPAYQKFGLFENFLFTNNSKAGADDYTNWLKFSSGKIKVIPNGYFLDDFIDLSDSTKINTLTNRFVVGGVARFSYEKDLELWVEVAHKLSEINKNVRFVLYGTGPLKASIIKRVESRGLSDIFFLQPPTSEIYRKLSEMKVMLLTSKVEGLPNVLIEAQLLGIPAVSTRAGGSGETYVHDSTGYEITSRDSSEIAKKINDLLRDSSLYQKFSKSAMEQARKNFDIELIGRKYLELYNAI